jgi:hypothetical protein
MPKLGVHSAANLVRTTGRRHRTGAFGELGP